jgi:hypothetical protein
MSRRVVGERRGARRMNGARADNDVRMRSKGDEG